MAGHSKWANIKYRKMAQDRKKSMLFSKLIRSIISAVKKDGPNPEFNHALRIAIQNARSANMPKDIIERAIEKAMSSSKEEYHNFTYEAFGPGGVAMLINASTGNPAHTAAMLRHILNKHGGTLATSGSTSHLFSLKSVFIINPPNTINEDEFIMEIIDAGAEDLVKEDKLLIVYAPDNMLYQLNELFASKGVQVEKAAREYIPISTIKVTPEQFQSVNRLIEALEEMEEVEDVFHNMEITEEIEKQLKLSGL